MKLREKLTLRDIGIWSHYVGDASQPLHVSVHFNGWGKYPNPNGYTTSTALHAHFEGEFEKRYLDRAAVAKAVIPYQDCGCGIEARVNTLLLASQGMVVPLYELEARGGFKAHNSEGVEFTTQRLAAGASALRDMIVDAWRNSDEVGVGYPMITVRDIESGHVRLRREMFGAD